MTVRKDGLITFYKDIKILFINENIHCIISMRGVNFTSQFP